MSKIYSYEEALVDSKKYFNGEELPAKVFCDKYALRNDKDELLESNPDQMHRRLAKEFARIEAKKFEDSYSEEQIYQWFKNYGQIIPQGSPIYGIGNPYQYVTLSNCYVLTPPEDSYNSILDTDKELVNISKRRGGVGIDLDNLRPKNSKTKNAARTTTGIVSWMERYSNSIREVGQGGRRGALLESLSVHHPDIEDFISIKDDPTKVTGANISVKLSDEFLEAVKNNTEYELRFPVTKLEKAFCKARNISPISKMVDAKKIWNKIIHNAWKKAEPGLLFWDNIIRESPADCYKNYGFESRSTNPCSELPLSILDSCRLLSINLFCCVINPFTKDAYFDFGKLYELAKISQRLMDDLIDLEIECIDRIISKIDSDPENKDTKLAEKTLWEKVRSNCINGRRTGLGITAIGDVLASLGIKYDSNEGIEVVDEIYKTLKFGSYRSSVDIAKELGPFPIWDWELEKDNPFINRIKDEDIMIDGGMLISGNELYEDIQKYGRRNIANLTTAPTGSISTQALLSVRTTTIKPFDTYKTMYGTTSGIEPLFKTHYIRRKKGNPGDKDFRVDFVDQSKDSWMEFVVYHPGVQLWMEVNNKTDLTECPYVEAGNINWKQRVKLQAAAQKHVDHSISSTVNVPENITEEEVSEIYQAAWESGCKGITIYRENCRTGVLIDVNKAAKKTQDNESRPKELDCDVHHVSVKGTGYFVLVGFLNNVPYEVFAGKNGFIDKDVKTGKIIKLKGKSKYKVIFDNGEELVPITAASNEHEETITRLTSGLLRCGADMNMIVTQLEKVGGDMTGFAKSIARCFKKYIKDGTKVKGEVCPECKSNEIIRQDGCKKCQSCGFSQCS